MGAPAGLRRMTSSAWAAQDPCPALCMRHMARLLSMLAVTTSTHSSAKLQMKREMFSRTWAGGSRLQEGWKVGIEVLQAPRCKVRRLSMLTVATSTHSYASARQLGACERRLVGLWGAACMSMSTWLELRVRLALPDTPLKQVLEYTARL